jgi:hypothetical protein
MKIKKINYFITIYFIIISGAHSNSLPNNHYQDTVLTNDHGILNTQDIKRYYSDLNPRPFTSSGPSGAYIYWQCFPRDHITITLVDTGYSSSDFGLNDNIADLKIKVSTNTNIIHQYNTRKRMPVSAFEKIFNQWRAIMKDEKYVCLAGSFIQKEDRNNLTNNKEIYQWTFEAIKSKHGCDGDLYGCSYKIIT